MKQATETKLKFKQLKRRLKLAHWQAVGLLESLWRITEANAPAGDIGRLTNDEIASAIEWGDNANDMIQALIECRWLDEDHDFRLIVHDWSDHCPNHLKGAFAKNNRQFADQIVKERSQQSGTKSNGAPQQQSSGSDRVSAKQPKEAGSDSAKHVPDGGAPPAKQPLPNLTKPNQNPTTPNLLAATADSGVGDGWCFALPERWNTPGLRKAVLAWARYFPGAKQGRTFDQIQLDSLVMFHSGLGWDAEKLERAITYSIARGYPSVYDPDQDRGAKKPAAESKYKPLPAREKST